MAKETGWSRDFILWELPLEQANQLQHAALRAANCWTVPPVTAAGAARDAAVVDAQLSAWTPPPPDDDDDDEG